MTDQQSVRFPPNEVAYLVLEFPKVSETFIVREITELRVLGWNVWIYALWSRSAVTLHAEVIPLLRFLRWRPPWTLDVIAANLLMLIRRPVRYVRTLLF